MEEENPQLSPDLIVQYSKFSYQHPMTLLMLFSKEKQEPQAFADDH